MNTNEVSTLVVVTRIESYVDPRTSQRGKRIEFSLLESHDENTYNTSMSTEVRIVKEMMMQLKNIGLPILQANKRILKMILFILPEEEKSLGIEFQVNHIYKIDFVNGKMVFSDVTEQYYLM